MKSNNQILERYNPAKEDKKKVSKNVRPRGRIIQIMPGFAVEVPIDSTPEEIELRKERALKQRQLPMYTPPSTAYKSKKANEKLLRP